MATTLLWSNSAAKDCYLVTFPNLETSASISVKSCSYFVIPDYYDSDIYRDEFSYPVAIRSLVTYPGTGFVVGATGLGNSEIVNPGEYITELQADATGEKHLTPAVEYSGSDPFMHIPPRPLKRSRTMLFFWDGTFDTSNVVGSCWMDEFKELATSKVVEL